jgi:hypothetical protein
MSNPQSPGLRRPEKGVAEQSPEPSLGGRKGPGEGGGKNGPTPLDNQNQEERRSNEPSASR